MDTKDHKKNGTNLQGDSLRGKNDSGEETPQNSKANLQLNSLEDFEKSFNNEDVCRIFLEDLRWPNGVICPYCGNVKCYKLNTIKFRKCSDKNCSRKFTVTQGSLLSSTKLSLLDWLRMIFLYTKSKGRFSSNSYTHRKLSMGASFTIDEKLRFIFESIPKTNITNEIIFVEACKNIFLLHGKCDFRRISFYLGKHIPDNNRMIYFDDRKDYSFVLTIATKLLSYGVQHKFYFTHFCSPEEIVTETFLAIVDDEEKNKINEPYVVAIMKKTMNKMWGAYIKTHPNLDRWMRKYKLLWKQDNRINLRNWYIKEQLRNCNQLNSWDSFSEIKEKIRIRREQIIEHRKKSGKLTEYEFLHTR